MLKVTAYKKGKPCSVGGVLFKEYKEGWCVAEMFQHNYRYLRLTQKLFTKEEADAGDGETKENVEVKTPEAPELKPEKVKKVEAPAPAKVEKPKRKRRTNAEIEADKTKVKSTEEAEQFSGFTSDSGEG